MQKKFQFRIAQMDLARQMETIPFIKRFIDLLAEYHYNALFLYLEWRIRTKTFDIGKEEGYSAEELRDIIEYAAKRKIMVIPGLATFGHAELLLRQKRFSGYSELRDGTLGRFFKDTTDDFCPSLKKTRTFLSSYIRETAAIFKESPYIHAGGDEVWDIGFCPLCRKKVKDLESERALYLEHMLFIHSLIKDLGKRMMLWDDMFEYYPELLPEMPRDIIMVDWQYWDNIRNYTGHMRNRCFEDRLNLYEKLGFEYMIGPADYTWYNISSFTTYAKQYHPAGAILTAWEKQGSLLYKYLPNTVMTGTIWSSPSVSQNVNAFKALQKLFGEADPSFLNAVISYAGIARRIPNVTLNALTSFGFEGPDPARIYMLEMIITVLTPYSGKLKTELANTVLTDILHDCTLKQLEDRSVRACWNLLHDMESESMAQLKKEIKAAGIAYEKFYVKHRRKKDSEGFCKMIDGWLEALQTVEKEAKRKCYLNILFALPDHFGVQKTQILVNGENVCTGVFKHLPDTFFEKFIFLPDKTEVKEVGIRCWGYSGEGIAYISARRGETEYIPKSVLKTSGIAEHPESVLTPDVNYVFLGCRNFRDIFEDRSKAAETHTITISMTEDFIKAIS